ncbi:MAG: hypothetical protein FJ267_04540 [Planctomycetes bacterium]|nr:hypothetical protein [Planctomycetota bacterium]
MAAKTKDRMEKREQLLLGGLIVAVAFWIGGSWLSASVFGPIRDKRALLVSLQKAVDLHEDDLLRLKRAEKRLRNWQARCLPPDPLKSKQRGDALNAQRLYLEWLTDLAQLSGFEELKVSPDQRTPKGTVYVSVAVKVEASARFEQLIQFLERFYKTDLLHRIKTLRITCREPEGDPALQIVLEAEGLALLDAPQRRTLFPQSDLQSELDEDGTTIEIDGVADFPSKPGFRVRIQNEFVEVTHLEIAAPGKAIWTVARGIDRTLPSSHPSHSIVQLIPQVSETSPTNREDLEIDWAKKANIFVKPAPPYQYRLRLAPLGEKTYTRDGKPFEFTISAMNYDTTKGKPRFQLTESSLAGLALDSETGKLTWVPEPSIQPGKYAVTFDVIHPSSLDGKLTETLTIVLKDPNTPPKFSENSPPRVYLGRLWKFVPEVGDQETTLEKLTWKLGENSPSGLTLDESTGELTWTPDDAVPLGETTVKVTASDDGTPPMVSTLELKLDVQDDAAAFTFLNGIFVVDGNRRAIFRNRSNNTTTTLTEGEQLAVADILGTISSIMKKYIVIELEGKSLQIEVGQSLREMTEKESQSPDASSPENSTGAP